MGGPPTQGPELHPLCGKPRWCARYVSFRCPYEDATADRHSSMKMLNLVVESHFIWAGGNESTNGWADGGK